MSILTLQKTSSVAISLSIPEKEATSIQETVDVVQWLLAEMVTRKLPFLLAHLDDGVVWGRLSDNGKSVLTSDGVAQQFSPRLQGVTLQTARCFGASGELLVWRENQGGFGSRFAHDKALATEAMFRECYDTLVYLWGTHEEESRDGFTLWREGAQGLRHAVPAPSIGGRPPRLRIRHYLEDKPMARVIMSRLVEFENMKG